MNKAPAFQWYPKDILGSARVAEMTLAEEGAYRRLIDFCWLNGSVPADPKRAAMIIGKGCTIETAETALSMFIQDPNDSSRMLHDRLIAEVEKQKRNRNQKSQAANARWGKHERPKNGHRKRPNSGDDRGEPNDVSYTLEQMLEAAKDPSVAISEADARDCFNHYDGEWVYGNGQPVLSLVTCLRRWKLKRGDFGSPRGKSSKVPYNGEPNGWQKAFRHLWAFDDIPKNYDDLSPDHKAKINEFLTKKFIS